MGIKIAVCDDSQTEARYIEELCCRWAENRKLAAETRSFPSAEAFLFHYAEEKNFDILLLDIEMKKMDGLSLAREIRKSDKQVSIVFITGYSDYIADGYEVEALHYLLKPVQEEKLFQVLDRGREKMQQTQKCLNLENAGEMYRIPLSEIRWLDVQRNYVTVHACEDVRVKKTLAEFEKELGSGFCRVGRSLIVNLKNIRRVTKNEVILADGTALPLPRGGSEVLNRAIIERT